MYCHKRLWYPRTHPPRSSTHFQLPICTVIQPHRHICAKSSPTPLVFHFHSASGNVVLVLHNIRHQPPIFLYCPCNPSAILTRSWVSTSTPSKAANLHAPAILDLRSPLSVLSGSGRDLFPTPSSSEAPTVDGSVYSVSCLMDMVFLVPSYRLLTFFGFFPQVCIFNTWDTLLLPTHYLSDGSKLKPNPLSVIFSIAHLCP